MTTPFSTHAFIAGALAPAFHGRIDLDKYDLGVAQAENFYVDFRGGLKSRPGTQFIQAVPADARIFELRLRKDQYSILVIASAESLTFVQEGAVVLDGSGDPLALTTPYQSNELVELRAHQFEGTIYLTHPNHKPRKLLFDPTAADIISIAGVDTDMRVDYAKQFPSFTPAEVASREAAFSAAAEASFNISAVESGSGSASIVYAISAVDARGVETFGAAPKHLTGIVNYAVTAGSVVFTWDTILGAEYYRIYRSIISNGDELDSTQPLGLIAEVKGGRFVDTNTSPDFTITPVLRFDPFADGSVLGVEVTSGTGTFSPSDTVTIDSATGTGAQLYHSTIDGDVTALTIVAGGTGYAVDDAIKIGTTTIGLVRSVSPSSGNNPRVFTRFQQHGVYAGTDNIPAGIWGSRRGAMENFDQSAIPTASDPYFYAIDNTALDPIEHLVAIKEGLLVFHPSGVERLVADEGRAVTALSAIVEQQSSVGSSSVPPLQIGDDIIFAMRQSTGIQALQYTFYQNSYTPQELSVLAAHYFNLNNPITSMTWQEEPDKLMWATQEDGTLLSFTYLRAQEIAGWARHHTDGAFVEVLTVNEPVQQAVYALVDRAVDGTPYRYLERFVERDKAAVSDFWCADSGLQAVFETPQTAVSGLAHLEGKTVSVLADGDAIMGLVVDGGAITLPAAATKVTVGLPYECLIETLPIASPQVPIDGKRKRAVGTAVRLQDTRGLAIGTRLDKLYEMKDRGFEDWGDVTQLRSDNTLILHSARWERDAKLFMKQVYPLPATVLGLVIEVEHGP